MTFADAMTSHNPLVLSIAVSILLLFGKLKQYSTRMSGGGEATEQNGSTAANGGDQVRGFNANELSRQDGLLDRNRQPGRMSCCLYRERCRTRDTCLRRQGYTMNAVELFSPSQCICLTSDRFPSPFPHARSEIFKNHS